jgi:peptidoglycan/xylan/chitin deacetylase (PgdA/CDA1 family)
VPVREAAFGVLGSRIVTEVAIRATQHRLRILAYHAIPDAVAFERQLIELAERFIPVSGAQVSAALTGRHQLPSRAVWVTFDDGFPEVETVGRPLLERYGFTATAFVCPGVIDTDQPYWWEVVREAARIAVKDAAGAPVSAALEFELKTVPDRDRREAVAGLAEIVEAKTGHPHRRPQMTTAQLSAWASAGHEVGNHTWDHPLLDQCEEIEQRGQIRRAHEWLRDTLGRTATAFAYPNGNWSGPVEAELRRLGYEVGVGFDHQLATMEVDPLRVSRLRLDSDASIARVRAVTAGLHSRALDVRSRSTSGSAGRADPRSLPPS